MCGVKDELINCAEELNINIRVLDKNETADITEKFRSKYIDERQTKGVFLWERLKAAEYLNDPMGWSYIGNFVGDTSCLLMFNDLDLWSVIEINNGNDLTELLGEAYGFEFYVMDKNLTYAVCFNHEDQLLCLGSAKGQLKKFKRKNKKISP